MTRAAKVPSARRRLNAFIAGLEAPAELVAGEAFNVGINGGNYTVRQLAETAQKVAPSSQLSFTGEHGSDSRTYRVSFEKILTVLKDYFKPEWDLFRGGTELVELFETAGFTEADFRSYKYTRLSNLERLVRQDRLDGSLRWIENKELCVESNRQMQSLQ